MKLDKQKQESLDSERFYYCADKYLREVFSSNFDNVDNVIDVKANLEFLSEPLVVLKTFKEHQ